MSPGVLLERPGVCLLGIGAVALVLLAGCIGGSEPSPTSGDEPEDRFTLSYEAEGPLYVPGFWPPNLVAEDGDRLNVTVTPGDTVVDARGIEVPAINVTYEFKEDWATHWVHPGTGKIIVVETRGWLNMQNWKWQASGIQTLFGQFENLTTGEELEQHLTVGCCNVDKAFASPKDEPLNLTLDSASGSLAWVNTTDGKDWSPPTPREVPRHDWPGRHAPAGNGQNLPFDLSDAVATAAEQCPETAVYMDQHPKWKTVSGFFYRYAGQVPLATEEHRWDLIIEGDADTARIADVRSHRPASPAPDLGPSVETCSSQESEAFGLWQRPGEPRTMGYTDAWTDLHSTVDPNEVWGRSTSIANRSGGPLFTGTLFFDLYESPTDAFDLEARGLTIDLQTGLLSSYAARNPPGEEIEQPLGETGGDASRTAPGTDRSQRTVAVCSPGLQGGPIGDDIGADRSARAQGCSAHRIS